MLICEMASTMLLWRFSMKFESMQWQLRMLLLISLLIECITISSLNRVLLVKNIKSQVTKRRRIRIEKRAHLIQQWLSCLLCSKNRQRWIYSSICLIQWSAFSEFKSFVSNVLNNRFLSSSMCIFILNQFYIETFPRSIQQFLDLQFLNLQSLNLQSLNLWFPTMLLSAQAQLLRKIMKIMWSKSFLSEW